MIRANLRKSILMSRGRLLWNLVGCKLLLCRITFPQLLQLPSYEFFSSRNLGRWRNLGARALGSWQPILTIGCNFKENTNDILKKFWSCIEEIKQKFWRNLGVGIWLPILIINYNKEMFVKWFLFFSCLGPSFMGNYLWHKNHSGVRLPLFISWNRIMIML